ncbi:MAG: protein TolQ [Oligoflexia bacterium]|nr:protein TolQ [Oligoflexia bacterium]
MDVTALVLKADIVVKIVMAALLLFSVLSWAVFFSKFLMLRKTEAESEKFREKFHKNRDMDKAYLDAQYHAKGYLCNLYIAGYRELKELCDNVLEQESLSNVQRAMMAERDRLISSINDKISFLATVGSSSPFIGLFGTVWGIMNAFRGLAIQKSATLSVVAPGIAEALIATAIGLFAAIPAVIFYNSLTKKIERIEQYSNSFIYEFMNITYRTFLQPELKIPEVPGAGKKNGSKEKQQESV